jgi:hypothetical protein
VIPIGHPASASPTGGHLTASTQEAATAAADGAEAGRWELDEHGTFLRLRLPRLLQPTAAAEEAESRGLPTLLNITYRGEINDGLMRGLSRRVCTII